MSQLQTVGSPLDGKTVAGVGIFFQQDAGESVYVAGRVLFLAICGAFFCGRRLWKCKRRLGIAPHGSMRRLIPYLVSDIVPDSPAEWCGRIMRYDILQKIGNQVCDQTSSPFLSLPFHCSRSYCCLLKFPESLAGKASQSILDSTYRLQHCNAGYSSGTYAGRGAFEDLGPGRLDSKVRQ